MTSDSDGIFVGRLSVVNTGRRRRWSAAEKARIVEESLMGHCQASATARRHDIPTSLLFRWRRDCREGRLSEKDEASSLVPAFGVPEAPLQERRPAVGRMEIVVHGGQCVIVMLGWTQPRWRGCWTFWSIDDVLGAC